MKTIAFIFLGLFASVIVGLIGSLVLGLGALVYEPIRGLAGRKLAILATTAVSGLIVLAWTAVILLWFEAGTPPYNPHYWSAIFICIMLAIAPGATAHRSSQGVIASQGLTISLHDLIISLGYVTFIQILGAIYMIIDRTALHWWRWLPLPAVLMSSSGA